MPVLAGAEPFHHDGSPDIGVLLCHGFTGSPQSMRSWGEYLAEEGFTVRCPRLPGHGTHWRDMNATRWQDWYREVERSLSQLRQCGSVFVCGQSMGGTLALRLAERHGAEIAGLTLVNPSVLTLRKDARLLPVLSRLLPSLPGLGNDIAKPDVAELAYERLPLRAMNSLRTAWSTVRAELPRVTQPVFLCRSLVDHTVEPVNARVVLSEISSEDVTDTVLRDSYHVATLDHDAPRIFAGSVEFIRRVHRERTGEPV